MDPTNSNYMSSVQAKVLQYLVTQRIRNGG